MGALIWPEAEYEARKYKAVLDTINNTQSSINKAADNHPIIRPVTFTNQTGDLYGEYFEIYADRVDEWIKAEKKIEEGFVRFQTSRGFIQLEASTQYGIWTARIGLRYPDPPESST
jgi:hypothetical protein